MKKRILTLILVLVANYTGCEKKRDHRATIPTRMQKNVEDRPLTPEEMSIASDWNSGSRRKIKDWQTHGSQLDIPAENIITEYCPPENCSNLIPKPKKRLVPQTNDNSANTGGNSSGNWQLNFKTHLGNFKVEAQRSWLTHPDEPPTEHWIYHIRDPKNRPSKDHVYELPHVIRSVGTKVYMISDRSVSLYDEKDGSFARYYYAPHRHKIGEPIRLGKRKLRIVYGDPFKSSFAGLLEIINTKSSMAVKFHPYLKMPKPKINEFTHYKQSKYQVNLIFSNQKEGKNITIPVNRFNKFEKYPKIYFDD